MIDQSADFEHALNGLAQGFAFGFLTQHLHLGHKALQLGARCATDQGGRITERAARAARGFLQVFNAARPNTAGRKVHYAQEAGFIVRVLDQAQVGQRVLHFRTFKKAHAAVHTVRNAGIEQLAFNHPALRVAAVEDGNFLAAVAIVAHQVFDLAHDPAGFIQIGGRLHHPHGFTGTLVGAQVFTQALAVVLNQRVGAVQNMAVAAVVLLQLDLLLHTKLAHKVTHIAHARTAEGIDALVIIAHRQHAGRALQLAIHHLTGQLLEPCVLQLVGVLKLVHQDKTEAALVVLAQVHIVTQHFKAAQHQLAKIHHAFTLALLFIQLVQLYLLFGIGVGRHHVFGAQPFFLATGNEPAQLLGRKALIVHVVLLAQALDGRELVLRIQNLESSRQARRHMVGAQQAVAQAVESANPHAAHVVGQHGRQAGVHLLGRLVGKGHGHDAAGRDLPCLQQPGNARGQHPRLARARTRQHQRMALRQGHGGTLLIVQALQQGRVVGWGRAVMGTVKQVNGEHSPPL